MREQQAQAAAIIGMAERLPDAAGREYIAARFGGITRPEHVTSMMNRIFQPLGTGMHGKREAYKLLLCYFGANIGYRAIRYDLKCRDETVIEVRRKVYDTLDLIGHRARGEMAREAGGMG